MEEEVRRAQGTFEDLKQLKEQSSAESDDDGFEDPSGFPDARLRIRPRTVQEAACEEAIQIQHKRLCKQALQNIGEQRQRIHRRLLEIEKLIGPERAFQMKAAFVRDNWNLFPRPPAGSYTPAFYHSSFPSTFTHHVPFQQQQPKVIPNPSPAAYLLHPHSAPSGFCAEHPGQPFVSPQPPDTSHSPVPPQFLSPPVSASSQFAQLPVETSSQFISPPAPAISPQTTPLLSSQETLQPNLVSPQLSPQITPVSSQLPPVQHPIPVSPQLPPVHHPAPVSTQFPPVHHPVPVSPQFAPVQHPLPVTVSPQFHPVQHSMPVSVSSQQSCSFSHPTVG